MMYSLITDVLNSLALYGCLCPGTGSGGLQDGLCQKSPGLPRARHSWFQMASTDPTTEHGRAQQPRWWHHCENTVKKGEKTPSEEWGRGASPSEETVAETGIQAPMTVIPFPKGNTGNRSQRVLVDNSWLWHLSSQATVMHAEAWLPRTPACW